MPDTLLLSIISTGVRVSTCSLARQIACLILATFCIAIPILTLVAWGWLVCCSFSYLKGGSEFDSAFEASAAAINNMYQDTVTTTEYHEKTDAAVAPAATRTKSRRARIIHRTKHNRIFRYLFSDHSDATTMLAPSTSEVPEDQPGRHPGGSLALAGRSSMHC
ncbi:hypothetical protein PG995_013831 [Apiospora arundinis]